MVDERNRSAWWSSRTLWVAAAILALSFAAYAPSLDFKYTQDSFHAVKINPVVERGDLREIFASDYWKDTISPARTLYRPATVSSFALERKLTGEADPRVSHLVNLLLHALTAFGLYWLARRLGTGELVSAVAALLFTAHPLLFQAVVNVVGRADLLAASFGLAALVSYTFTGSFPGYGRRPWVRRPASWATGVFAFIAMCSKEIGVAVVPLLLVLALIYRAPEGGRSRPAWIETAAALVPVALAAVVYVHLRTVAIGVFPGWQPLAVEDNVLVGLHGMPRLATTLAMAARYAGLLLWPQRLLPDYSGGVIAIESSPLAPMPLVGLLLLLSLLFGAIAPFVLGSRASIRIRAASVGSWLYLLPYLLIGNLLTLNAAGFAERLIYFSATGYCLLLALAVDGLTGLARAERRRAVRNLVAAVVVIAVIAGVAQTRKLSPMWETNDAMFVYAREAAPRSLRPSLVAAGKLEARGRFDEALALYEEINEFAPSYGGAWMSRGVLLARGGDSAGAERLLRHAIELRPEIGEAHMNLGLVLVQSRQFEEAERELRRALLLDASLVKAAAQLGHLLFESGRYAEAVHFYQGCVELGREDLRPRMQQARARARARGSEP